MDAHCAYHSINCTHLHDFALGDVPQCAVHRENRKCTAALPVHLEREGSLGALIHDGNDGADAARADARSARAEAEEWREREADARSEVRSLFSVMLMPIGCSACADHVP